MSFFKKNTSFSLTGIEAGHFNFTYRGIPCKKCPFDYAIYQMIVCETKPDLIIEVGTFMGGSTLYLADLLELNGRGEVHTIDPDSKVEDDLVKKHPRIRLFDSSFRNYELNNVSGYDVVMVIEDGSHHYEDSKDALKLFSPLVTKNSYFIVEDGIVSELGKNRTFNGGPQKAIAEFINANPDFIIDRSWCDFFGPNATFNINGYLKRIS